MTPSLFQRFPASLKEIQPYVYVNPAKPKNCALKRRIYRLLRNLQFRTYSRKFFLWEDTGGKNQRLLNQIFEQIPPKTIRSYLSKNLKTTKFLLGRSGVAGLQIEARLPGGTHSEPASDD